MWVLCATAFGQATGGEVPDLNAQTLRPSIDGDRLLWADDAGKRESGTFTGRLLVHYTDDPLVYVDDQGTSTGLVTSIFQTDLLGGATFGPVRIGVDLPVFLFTSGE